MCAGCLPGVERLSEGDWGGCVEVVRRLSGGMGMLSGGCREAIWMVWEGYLEGVGRLY